jgi:hypothetical protein
MSDLEELKARISAAKEKITEFGDVTAPNAVWFDGTSDGTFTPRKVVEPFLAELLRILGDER